MSKSANQQFDEFNNSAIQQTSNPTNRSPFPPYPRQTAPDLTDDELDNALAAITRTGMDGVIATNTTLRPRNLHSPSKSKGPLQGGTAHRAEYGHHSENPHPHAGSSAHHRRGRDRPDDAKAKLDAGATLVQVYTGLIYSGPGLVKAIVKSL